jgi:hypothetical protein
MMKKAKGRDIEAFIRDGMKDTQFFEDNELKTYDKEGNFILNPDESYPLDQLGYIGEDRSSDVFPFATLFNRWFKERTVALITVEVPKTDAASATERLKELGFKVVK